MSTLQDSDLLLVNRSNTSYKVTWSDIKDQGGIGSGAIKPSPGDEGAVPPYQGGAGTAASPYILAPAEAFLAGDAESEEVITFFGFEEGATVAFVDENSATNGGRFVQPLGTIQSDGRYSFRLKFIDLPQTSSAPQTYTGLIKCGNVYFSWNVTVLLKGVVRPTITKLVGNDGTEWDAPQSPAFNTSSKLGLVTFSSNPSGLSANQVQVPITITFPNGSGASLIVSTNDVGVMTFHQVVGGGSGYIWSQGGTANLSPVGGSSSTPITGYTQPITAPNPTVTVTNYQDVNAGGFSLVEWQFADDAQFLTNVRTFTFNESGGRYTPSIGLEASKVWYARCRYKSVEDVYSAWSVTVRSAVGSLISFRYMLKAWNYNRDVLPAAGANNSGPAKNFDSNIFYISPLVGQRIYFVKNYSGTGQYPGYNNPAWQSPGGNHRGGPIGSGSGQGHGNQNSAPGAWQVLLVTRNIVKFRVVEVYSNGEVKTLENANASFGIADYFIGTDGNPAKPLPSPKTVYPKTESGGGSGLSITLKRDNAGLTVLNNIISVGANYAVGDIVSFNPPYSAGDDGDQISIPYKDTVSGNYYRHTLDSVWDVCLHGIGGVGGDGNGEGGYVQFVGNGTSGSGNGGTAQGGRMEYSLYGEDFKRGSPGSSSGAGWGSGNALSAGNYPGSGAGASMVAPGYIDQWFVTDDPFGSQSVDIYPSFADLVQITANTSQTWIEYFQLIPGMT